MILVFRPLDASGIRSKSLSIDARWTAPIPRRGRLSVVRWVRGFLGPTAAAPKISAEPAPLPLAARRAAPSSQAAHV